MAERIDETTAQKSSKNPVERALEPKSGVKAKLLGSDAEPSAQRPAYGGQIVPLSSPQPVQLAVDKLAPLDAIHPRVDRQALAVELARSKEHALVAEIARSKEQISAKKARLTEHIKLPTENVAVVKTSGLPSLMGVAMEQETTSPELQAAADQLSESYRKVVEAGALDIIPYEEAEEMLEENIRSLSAEVQLG